MAIVPAVSVVTPWRAEHLFTTVAKTGRLAGVSKMDFKDAIQWYREQARKVRSVNVNRLVHGAAENRTFKRMDASAIGEMCIFHYDAKYKDTLPYWDQVPCVFVVDDTDPEHFLAINLHYLSPYRRAQLMNQLYTLAIKEKDKIRRLKLSYRILKGASRFAFFKPCLKSYLKSNVKSRFLYVEPKMWDTAMLLPIARFAKASENKVWRDSNKIIREG